MANGTNGKRTYFTVSKFLILVAIILWILAAAQVQFGPLGFLPLGLAFYGAARLT